MEAVAEKKATLAQAQEMGLTKDEFEKIIEILGRVPNFTEVSIFSVMWSEHCSYKNSIIWLKKLPRDGDHLLVQAGEENAGLVDIGDGVGCCFKIESHNHPSAVEPYQGAATGVGGINRDIFTMGARPIAQLNSLRFGDITLDRTKWLIKGVVKGIGDYGNAFGIPVLGGELFFDPCYNTNPLVNAMSVGIMSKEDLISATSYGVGNPVFIVGSSTGKDGIHGATFASGDITEDSANDLPSVQVGDPFQEKLLMEASLELAKTDAIIGMQDMGAAGITCSTTEMSDKGGHGMRIDLDKVPTRQADMVPFEILLSESQERMLVVVKKGREDEVNAIFDKWDLNCVEIGEVTEGDQVKFYMNGELVADVPASHLVLGGGAPVYERESKEPAYFAESKKFDINSIAEPDSLKEVAEFLTGHYNIASKKWVTEQYDSMVGTVNMSTNNPSDAGIANLKDSNKAIAMTVDCNARFVYSDPEEGTAMAVAEAARNIVCSGGKPSAVTNCLNFGNPYNPEVFWQFSNAIMGMKKACEKFNTPVTGGNVSFYNQVVIDGKDEAVFPTPTIGMIGVIEDKKHITPLAFQEKGDLIYLLGDVVEDINSSEYLYSYHNVKLSPAPHFDLDKEALLQDTLLDLIKMDMIASAHDCADGGLYITLLEMAMVNGFGFDIITSSEVREDAFMFGESPSRVVVSISRDKEDLFLEIMEERRLSILLLGHVTQGKICVDEDQWAMVEDAKLIFDTSLEKMIV
ncbi:MAG: phosphoribosylformylglycinamidine synthase subunit PurL [Flavobacteriales bacterium]|nr:phosphoribosylformylglycinamidine synthase subunit PurL [Flavobacteriales bacterium]